MAKTQSKRIREKALKIQNGWNEGAPHEEQFRNTTKAAYDAKIAKGLAADAKVESIEAQLTIARDERDDVWAEVGGMSVDVREGIVGHKDYGKNSPLYESAGFVRESEKASGLTRRTKKEDGK